MGVKRWGDDKDDDGVVSTGGGSAGGEFRALEDRVELDEPEDDGS